VHSLERCGRRLQALKKYQDVCNSAKASVLAAVSMAAEAALRIGLTTVHEAMLFADIHDLKGQVKVRDSLLSCTQMGVLSAIHPTLKMKAQARMNQR